MFKKSLIACAVMVTAFQAQAIDFSVTGIVTPGACSMTLGGGGVAAYGTITAATVRATWTKIGTTYERYYPQVLKTLPLMVNCPTPTKMALSFLDNRRSSATAETSEENIHFGLGYYGIGSSQIAIGSLVLDGQSLLVKATPTSAAVVPLKRLFTTGVATPTSVFAAGDFFEALGYIPHDKSFAYGLTAAATSPDAITEISGEIAFQPFLKKSLLDTATTDIIFDGSGTITLIIL